MSTRVNSTHVDNLELTVNSAAPFTPGADERFLAVVTNTLQFWDGTSWTTVGSVPGGATPTFETLFAADATFTITPDSTLTFAGNRATATDVVTFTNIAGGSGDVIQITNAGTGYDIEGTSGTWFVTKTGAVTGLDLTLTGTAMTTSAAMVWTLLDNNAAGLKIGSSGATDILKFVTTDGSEAAVFGNAVTITDGQLNHTSTSNTAATFILQNDTATTLGVNSTEDAGVVVFSSDTLTTGNLLRLQLDESALNGGHFLKMIQTDAGTTVFSVGENGNTTIAGTGGSNMFTVTAGDLVVSDGSLTIVDADDAATVSVTNSTATTANVFLLTGAGVFTGTGANSFFNVTQSGATTGTVASVIANGLTTGTALSVTSTGTIATTGELVSFVANSATTTTGLVRLSGTSLTDGWAIEATGGGANFTASGGMLKLTMGAATVGTGLSITTTGVYTGTTGIVDINAASATTGVLVDINGAGLTSGTAIKVSATEATLTTGKYLEFYDGAANDFSVAKYGATVIAGNALGTAALTLTAGDVLISSGNLTVSGKMITSGTETIAAGGTSTALSLTKTVHYIDADAGGDTFTLADGVAGQIMYIMLTSSTGVATITPANLAGGTSVTLNADGDSVILMFMDTEWFILGGNSYGVS